MRLAWLRIPKGLRDRRQWAVATLLPKPNGKLDKAPRHPATGHLISVTEPDQWVTFEEAANAGYAAIGYILSPDDPYTIIDLDPYMEGILKEDLVAIDKIYAQFESYAERSQSGNGIHFVLEGDVRGGYRRGGVEVYDQERFMICTGDVAKALPPMRQDFYLERLISAIGHRTDRREIGESLPERFTDAEIIEKLTNARNSQKFVDLYYRSPAPNEDWSQRDAALAQMIVFYTENHNQAIRIFAGSKLYRPHGKGKNPQHYHEYYLLERTFGRAWHAEKLRKKEEEAATEHGADLARRAIYKLLKTEPVLKQEKVITFPQGLVGEVASFIYGTAVRPVAEIALAGAITFMAGICGRQFNFNRSALNQYVVLVAKTGRGKDAAKVGIDHLISAIRPQMPAIDQFVGPGRIASGQALAKALATKPCMFSFLPEFGHTFRILTDSRVAPHDRATRQVLLDLYTRGAEGSIMPGSIYSDHEKNAPAVSSPCFSFIGDTTPETYYGAFSNDAIGDGLLPRFLTIDYDGPRVPPNANINMSPEPDMLGRLTSLLTSVLNMQHTFTVTHIARTAQASSALNTFETYCDNRINSENTEVAEIWNRAHLKVIRLAALIAVGRNPFAPEVDIEDVLWAQDVIERDLKNFSDRSKHGQIGGDEKTQIEAITYQVAKYAVMTKEEREKVCNITAPLSAVAEIIPFDFLRRRLHTSTSFKNSVRGTRIAIAEALKEAQDAGIIMLMSGDQVARYNMGTHLSSKFYTLGPNYPISLLKSE